jgi:hypothetical protein
MPKVLAAGCPVKSHSPVRERQGLYIAGMAHSDFIFVIYRLSGKNGGCYGFLFAITYWDFDRVECAEHAQLAHSIL